MKAEIKMSAKGRVTIPKALRERLGWSAGTRLHVEILGGAVMLRPIKSRAERFPNDYGVQPPDRASQPR